MKAEDLMVGDWVKPLREKLKGTPGKVVTPDGGCNICWIDCEEYSCLVPCDELEPIPLTPEILEKNGFENDFYEDVSVADYHSIRVEGYSLKGKVDGWDDFLIDFCNGSVNVVTDFHGEFRGEIGYVHTFQHALKLCGIEKEIVV